MVKKKRPVELEHSIERIFIKKEHEVGWVTTSRIGVLAFIVYMIIALMMGAEQNLRELMRDAFWFGFWTIMLIALIVGITKISENTAKEIKKLNKK